MYGYITHKECIVPNLYLNALTEDESLISNCIMIGINLSIKTPNYVLITHLILKWNRDINSCILIIF